MRARSACTSLPEMSLPSQTVSGDEPGGKAPWMSPRVTMFGDRLGTSTPTACLPGIGARMRISVVARAYARSSRSAATLPTFVPGASLQLVARHARAGDGADDAGLDAEVLQRLGQRGGDALAAGVVGLHGARAREHRRVGQPVVAHRRRRAEVLRASRSRSSEGSPWLGLGRRLGVGLGPGRRSSSSRRRALGRRPTAGAARWRRRDGGLRRRRRRRRASLRPAGTRRARGTAACASGVGGPRRRPGLAHGAGGESAAPGASAPRPRPRRRRSPAAARRRSARAPSSVTPASPMTDAERAVQRAAEPGRRGRARRRRTSRRWPAAAARRPTSARRPPRCLAAAPAPCGRRAAPRSRRAAPAARPRTPRRGRGRRPRASRRHGAVDAEPEHEQRVHGRAATSRPTRSRSCRCSARRSAAVRRLGAGLRAGGLRAAGLRAAASSSGSCSPLRRVRRPAAESFRGGRRCPPRRAAVAVRRRARAARLGVAAVEAGAQGRAGTPRRRPSIAEPARRNGAFGRRAWPCVRVPLAADPGLTAWGSSPAA